MNKTIKAIALSLLLGICLVPSTSFAQQFFSANEEVENTNGSEKENRTPLGSGIAIFVAAGAGYAVLKNRNK